MNAAIKRELQRLRRRKTLRGIAFIAPALLFVALGFLLPLALTLYKSVENSEVGKSLPTFAVAIRDWNGRAIPDEDIQAALVADLKRGFAERTLGIAGRRLNMEIAGFLTLLQTTARRLFANQNENSATQSLAQIDSRWTDLRYWHALKRSASRMTDYYFLAALDLRRDDAGTIVAVPEDRSLYVDVALRSLWISLCVTLICLGLALPIAAVLSGLSQTLANIGLMLVLLPFWTSVLVRTAAWVILLQREGLINATLLAVGLIDAPQALIFNRFGVIVALSHVLLPYMVLSLYAVMRGVDANYTRAARSLGANPWQVFWRVYLPQILPGIGAGCLLVFILAIGSYVTPALVGGRHDQMISYFIAYNVNQSVNWGLAAALSTFLLAAILTLYFIYGRLAGVEKVRVG